MKINKKPKFVSFIRTISNEPIEMVYDRESNTTRFVCLDEHGKIRFLNDFCLDPREDWSLEPYPASNSIVSKGLVLFPSEPIEYGKDEDLIQEIQVFIHRYLDVSRFFEKIASYYVLFSWVYDSFNELPYLRAIGDYGSGKTRFLQTIGSICYKPILANGATTVSPIFRLIDEFKGTLVLDEADFQLSEMWSEMIKILNSGHAKGMPVVRSESGSGNSFEPTAFEIFCPKIISTRGYFKDKALESRFIVEEMGHRKLRSDISYSLSESFEQEALKIRNKLLLFRLKNFGKKKIDRSLEDRSIEPRLNQIIVPLLSIIKDEPLRAELKISVSEYHKQMIADRGMEMDGQIAEVIHELLYEDGKAEPTIGQIKDRLEEKFGSELDRKLTARWVGSKIRNSFNLHTTKTRDGYIIPISEKDKLNRIFERFGVVNIVNDEKVENRTIQLADGEVNLEEIGL